MRRLWIIAVLLASIAWTLGGCEKKEPAIHQSTETVKAATTRPKVEHPGEILGRVLFSGKTPNLPPLDTSSVADCAKHHPGGIPDESVVINPNGTLKNVFVYLKDAPAFDGATARPVVLDQVNCQYIPHIVGVQVGQELLFKSSDPFLHNLHVADSDPPLNWAFTGVQQRAAHFSSPGFLAARCDVHPWMKAIVGVFANSYFAVTDNDGNFRISNVPPGHYMLITWHERFGELSQSLTVPPDGKAHIDFTYR